MDWRSFLMGQFIDLTGQRFGKLTVLNRAPTTEKEASWHCQCDCGNKIITRGTSLRSGASKTCGVLMVRLGKNG